MHYIDLAHALFANFPQQTNRRCYRTAIRNLQAENLCPIRPNKQGIEPIHGLLMSLAVVGGIHLTGKDVQDNAEALALASEIITTAAPLQKIELVILRSNGVINEARIVTVPASMLAIIMNVKTEHTAKILN